MERIPGIITSIQLKWGTDYPWEIALTEPEEEKVILDDRLKYYKSSEFIENFTKPIDFDEPAAQKIEIPDTISDKSSEEESAE